MMQDSKDDMRPSFFSLTDLVSQDETLVALPPGRNRDLIINALHALWRERNRALRVAENVAEQRREPAPKPDAFGVDEVTQMLRAYGASPIPF